MLKHPGPPWKCLITVAPLTRLARRWTVRLWHSVSKFDTRLRSFERPKDSRDILMMRARPVG